MSTGRVLTAVLGLLLAACAARQPADHEAKYSLPSASVLHSNVDPDLEDYRINVMYASRRYRKYPEEAIKNGWGGKVVILVTVTKGGRTATILRNSSGYQILDSAAMETIAQAAAETTVPSRLTGRDFSVEIPITYELKDVDASPAPTPRPMDAEKDWVGKIRAKVRANLAIPSGTPLDIEAKFSVVQLPSGEILEVQMLASSGLKPYDEAAEKAILKSSPLPKAPAGLFRRDLILTVRPRP